MVVVFITVPSGWVVVVVLVLVELVELVVTGTGTGSTTFSVLVVEEHPAASPQAAATIRTSPIWLNKCLII